MLREVNVRLLLRDWVKMTQKNGRTGKHIFLIGRKSTLKMISRTFNKKLNELLYENVMQIADNKHEV